MIWQKSCATDTIPFRQVRNLGQKPRYFVEHSHPAIVSCADFQRVQELMSSRKEQFQRAHCTKKGSLYDKHIYCGECGSLCRKKITGGKTYWVCRRHDGDRANCPIPQIPEPEITAAVLRLYHKLKFGQETVLRPALSQLQELRERELRSNRKISDIDNEIARISEQNLVLVRLKSKGYVDSALYLSQMNEIDHTLDEGDIHDAVISAMNELFRMQAAKDAVKAGIAAVLAGEEQTLSLPAVEHQIRNLQERQLELFQLIVSAGADCTDYDEELQQVYMAKTKLMAQKAELEKEHRGAAAFDSRLAELDMALEQASGALTDFDELTVRQLVSNIKVLDKDSLLICFKDGTEITQTIQRRRSA